MIQRRALAGAAAMFLAAPSLAAQDVLQPRDDRPAPGWQRGVLIRWGDRVTFDAPPWDPQQPSAEAAAGQFGWDARLIAFLPSPATADGVLRGLLALGHPTVAARLAFPDGRDWPEVAGMMQGASVINVERRGAAWLVVDGGYQNRRLTAATLCRIGAGGPACRGVFGISGGCATPWGTLLLAEGEGAAWANRLPDVRPETIGWVVELDPTDPRAIPVKRPALGRFGAYDLAATVAADGRAVVWFCDGRAGGYLYRFVSTAAAGRGALEAGQLAVARLEAWRLRWLPLRGGDLLAAARDSGATALPEAVALVFHPRRHSLAMAMRGGAGMVLEIRPTGGDAAAETAAVAVLLTGREAPLPEGRRRPAPPPPPWPWAPASLADDGGEGFLIGTDRGLRPGLPPEMLFRFVPQQEGGDRPELLLAAPLGGAIKGAAVAPEGTIFAAIAHPGLTAEATWHRPPTRWPNFRPEEPPRSSVVFLFAMR